MIDEAREVLRQHEVLLVHFNGPASRHDTGYPKDLSDAIANPQWAMCYSTVDKSDQGPYEIPDPSDAPVFGSVGIVVDLHQSSKLISVLNSDAGSSGRSGIESFGIAPSLANCEASIVSREGYNEWFLENPRIVGIFAFCSAYVWLKDVGEVPRPLEAIANDFPNQRIFTILDGQFHELERTTGKLIVRMYSEIIAP